MNKIQKMLINKKNIAFFNSQIAANQYVLQCQAKNMCVFAIKQNKLWNVYQIA